MEFSFNNPSIVQIGFLVSSSLSRVWRESCRGGAMAIPLLPKDTWMDILSRLPVKSLLELRFVSKSWFSLICCTDFAKLQFKRASSVPDTDFYKIIAVDNRSNTIHSVDGTLSSFDDPAKSQKFELPFEITLRCFDSVHGFSSGRILGSVNGLLCVSTSEYDRFHIYNPSTKQYKKIPNLRYPEHTEVQRYGFGYDSTTDDYKIVLVILPKFYAAEIPDAEAMISIFSLKRYTWRSFLDNKYLNNNNPICVKCACGGTFLNNAIHWTFKRLLPKRETLIVSFGLAEESFSIIPVPHLCKKGDRLSVLAGCLCLSNFTCVCEYGICNHCTLTIWMLKEYGLSSSWTELITMTTREDENSSFHSKYLSPLYFTQQGEILLSKGRRSLASFDTRTKSFKNHRGFYSCGFHPIVHVETLISPKEVCGQHG